MDVWPGHWQPLGATADDGGTNFALFSAGATGVTLCLFDATGTETRVPLTSSTNNVWHGYLPGVGVGTRYGYRVDGPFNPNAGQRFNVNKLLVDPYARALDGEFILDDAVFGYPRAPGATTFDDTARDDRDSGPFVQKSVVVHDTFDWSGEVRPSFSMTDSIIYEVHVRGFTKRHPDIPSALQGTYAGLAHPAAIDYLTKLGVTTLELMPVHHFVSEVALLRRGLSNYWGYNTLGFFAPHAGYSSSGTAGEQVTEFKQMVKALHNAGLEVILDVVYNHSAEGDEFGPTLTFGGIDNGSYYRLQNGHEYLNYTGCGNTIDVRNLHVVQMITDSMRYWVTEMHVDGFRFDLALTLGRASDGFDPRSTLLAAINQDPLLSKVKLIAEPWDLGGYAVGAFPPPWSEWNDRFRNTVRDFWLRGSTDVRELGYRLSGSSNLFEHDGRQPSASLNFVTCHDGFTLHDLVAYNSKHNEANGENNRDGSDDNHNWNCGVEGETDDAGIIALRGGAERGMLATLLLSAGVPMIGHGDELGRTQRGNNNAYCQDNELAWIDWSAIDSSLLEFTRAVIALRRAHPVFRQSTFFNGSSIAADGVKDIAWFRSDGAELASSDWSDLTTRTIGIYLSGKDIRQLDDHGAPIIDDSFLIVLHAGQDATPFTLPGPPWADGYEIVVGDTVVGDTVVGGTVAGGTTHAPGSTLTIAPTSVVVLRAT